jgi:hypothetical protein
MAMNPIQFQPGMSLSELFEQYGTEAQCEQALEQARWPTGFQCPHCGASEHSTFSNRLLGGMQNISSVGAGLIWSSNRRALSCNSRGNLLACRLLIQCQWQISKFDTKTIAWTDLPWMAGYPTLPYPTLPRHEGPVHTPRPSADHYRQVPGIRRCEDHRRLQPFDETADPHHESRPAARAQSNRCGSLTARVLVTFPPLMLSFILPRNCRRLPPTAITGCILSA